MRIEDLFPGAKIAQTNQTSPADLLDCGGPSFKEILASQTGLRSNPSTPGTPLESAGALASEQSGLRIEGLMLTEDTLSLLETYGETLGDSAVPTHDLAPYLSALADKTLALREIAGQLPADDPLAKLLDQVASVSFVQVEKYERGDFGA